MKVTFYFDPSCPWCWVTSRWLVDISQSRDVEISWRPFSLALKNQQLNSNSDNKYAVSHRQSHRALRAIESAVANGADRGKLYSDIGKMKHVDGYEYTDMEIELMLSLNGLDKSLLSEADNPAHDDFLQKSVDEAVSIVGNDVGVPLIVFEKENGEKTGYFGPVLMRQPTGQEALDLWDGLSKLASSKDFYELKRSRPKGGPDTSGPQQDMVC